MKRASLAVLNLSGDPLEIVYQLGKRRAKRIARGIEYWNREIRHVGARRAAGTAPLYGVPLQIQFLKEAQKQTPEYVEEIHAMAEGAGVPFSDLFRLNLTEFKPYLDKCTTLILPMKTKEGKRILIVHNEDWNPKRSNIFLLKAKLPDVSYAAICFDGYLPTISCGINSHGLAHYREYRRLIPDSAEKLSIF